MSTEFINDQWRLPNEENKSKVSNYSMDFDSASSDYIDAGSASYLNSLSQFSISVWFNLTTAASNKCIVSDWNYNTSPLGHFGLQSWDASGSSYALKLYIKGTIDAGDRAVQTSAILSENTWHHAVFTYNSGTVTCYVDGSSVSLTTTGTIPTILTNQDGNLLIGKFGGLNRFFDGQIDAVAIFNYALTDGTGGTVNQIAALYGSSSTGIGNPMSLSPKPVAYYPLGDQDSFNGSNYLVPNSSLKDYVFDFDGSNKINLGTANSYNIITLSVWVKPNSPPNYAGIFGTRNLSGVVLPYHLGSVSNTFRFIVTDSTGLKEITANTSFSNNVWYHVVGVADGSTTKLYIDGVLQTATGSYNGTISTPDDDLMIGAQTSIDTSYEWVGQLSNTQIFNTALPATGSNSIETLYNNGSPLTSMTGFTSLVSWYKLNASDTYDGTNWTIEDHAGSNDGTSSGMTQSALQQSDLSFTSGYSPYALDFDAASNNKITASANSNFDTGDLSASIWVYSTNLGNNIEYFFGNSNALGTAGFTFSINSSNGYAWYIGRATTTHEYIIYNVNINFINNVWNHLCFSYDDTTKGFILYLNGASVNSGTATSNTKTASGSIIIGGHHTNYDFTGKLSNASIWDTSLTSAQVKELYNEGVPSNLNNHSAYSNLVSWWQLGSNSSFNTNWTVLDEVAASGNNGTSVNMTEADIVDGVGSYANGLSSGMGGDEVIGSAPFSDANSLSINMDVLDRTEDTPS